MATERYGKLRFLQSCRNTHDEILAMLPLFSVIIPYGKDLNWLLIESLLICKCNKVYLIGFVNIIVTRSNLEFHNKMYLLLI